MLQRRAFIHSLLVPAILPVSAIMPISTRLNGYCMLRNQLIASIDYGTDDQISIRYVDGEVAHITANAATHREVGRRNWTIITQKYKE